MVKPEIYDEIINQLSNMDSNQLKTLAILSQGTLDRRKNFFDDLVTTLADTLRTINAEFPNAVIPLVVSPTETIDLMDYIIPADFADKCQMGGEMK